MAESKSTTKPLAPARPREPGSETRCPFCHERAGPLSSVVCTDCLVRHHPDCWGEGHGCSSCGATTQLVPVLPMAPESQALYGTWSYRVFHLPVIAVGLVMGLGAVLRWSAESWFLAVVTSFTCLMAAWVTLSMALNLYLDLREPRIAVRGGEIVFRRWWIRTGRLPLDELWEVRSDSLAPAALILVERGGREQRINTFGLPPAQVGALVRFLNARVRANHRTRPSDEA